MTEIPPRKCFNCKSEEAMNRPLFCDDCWRMAILAVLAGGSGGEGVHRILSFFLSSLPK